MSNATGHEADYETSGYETTDYEDALRDQQELEAAQAAQQPEIPHSSRADVTTMILVAVMLVGFIICMTIYM